MCPFIEQADRRCAQRLCLKELDQALGVCADCYQDCPLYQQKLLADAKRGLEHPVAAG